MKSPVMVVITRNILLRRTLRCANYTAEFHKHKPCTCCVKSFRQPYFRSPTEMNPLPLKLALVTTN